jgi:hypothetical protein
MRSWSWIFLPNTAELTPLIRLRHRWILLRWRRWAVPALCCLPYLGSILWLMGRGLYWVAAVLLAPLLMGLAVMVLTWWLERLEFRRSSSR